MVFAAASLRLAVSVMTVHATERSRGLSTAGTAQPATAWQKHHRTRNCPATGRQERAENTTGHGTATARQELAENTTRSFLLPKNVLREAPTRKGACVRGGNEDVASASGGGVGDVDASRALAKPPCRAASASAGTSPSCRPRAVQAIPELIV